MPGLERERVHRFRDHAVAGVNWRPTRFVDEVPNSRVCCLCRMIPKRTVLLPCSHVLCQSCHAASSVAGAGLCPLDREPFEESECHGADFPARKADALQAYCWNEEHGCEFTGTMEALLRHYEMECAFHTVGCLRCGQGVLHQDLSMHYVAACSADVSSAVTENPSPEHTVALTLQDLSNAQEDLKALLKVLFHDQLLPAIQSQMNELTEQVKSQEARFTEITTELKASERSMSSVSQLPNSAPEAGTSSSLSSRSEKALILRKLEHFANVALSGLERVRRDAPQQNHRPVIAYCQPVLASAKAHLRLTSALSTSVWLSEEVKNMKYVLTVENAEEICKCEEKKRTFAELTWFHTRDTYFTVAVNKSTYREAPCLALEVQFNGLLVGSQFVPLKLDLKVWKDDPTAGCYMCSFVKRCFCVRDQDSLPHIHRVFWMELDALVNDGYLRDGEMTFDIQLEDMTNWNWARTALRSPACAATPCSCA
ncbi:uncharacterized protein [Dermacentor albipictus]|uniref:uncharacterized protein isoform X2 n=1 Tax=Dermacentor albipictus TaxID=60249 RepID=UPI0038FCB488